MRNKVEKYTALVAQPEVTVARTRDEIKKNLDRVCNLIDFGVGYFYEDPGATGRLPRILHAGRHHAGQGRRRPGRVHEEGDHHPRPRTGRAGEKAQEYSLYIAGGGVIEKLPQFPDRWFNTAFIIGPSGDVILKYHKWHIPASIGLGTSPHDMLDEYSAVFGNDIKTRFPVVDTEIGKLGCMTCHDGATPEVSRALAFNGCEVICHPGAIQEVEGVSKPWDFWVFTRRTRAHDNMCYLLGSNWGSVNYDFYPKAFCPGNSMIIDYTGMVLREAPYPAEQLIAATIDIEGLREHRTIANHNMWIDVRTEGFREMYEHSIYPPNLFPPGKPPRTLADKIEGAKTAMAGLYGRGHFTPPHGYEPEDMPGLLAKRVKYAQDTGRLRKG